MKWYVLHTYSGFEQKVRQDILEGIKREEPEVADNIGEIIVPMEPPPPPGEKKTPGGRRKFFPGYILVQMNMTDKTHHFIRHRPNVTGFIGNDEGPRPLSEKEVENIKHQMSAGPVKVEAEIQYEEGNPIKIKDGPFAGFSGVVEEVRAERRKLRVLVMIFGRATPVELDFHQVERSE